MPGRVMDQPFPVGSPELKKDRGHVQESALPSPHSVTSVQPAPRSNGSELNGANISVPNGALASDNHITQTTSDSDISTGNASTIPPILDQSWRESGAFPSLGVLLERQAQHCYQNLSRCLTTMSELGGEAQTQQLNGGGLHTELDTSKSSQERKRLIMAFAKEQREFFIKSLVLVDWCRNADDIYKIKDVSEWQRKQEWAQISASDAFIRMRGNMVAAKMPNPNIDGAMELMSTGKASWIPDLGFLPSGRLSAKQLLDTLRNMNIVLATRLALHDDLCPQMQDYTIANGRATFTVKDEFEVDLTIADEDVTSPFYFIDIRLLYKPSTTLDNTFRTQSEWRINHMLATKGLKGAYDFLHNFILTHKINVLRGQAADMIAGRWFDCIHTERLRRNLIVQYWVGVPGKKSWVEFGLISGKHDSMVSQSASSRIGVRWFRHGVLVEDPQFNFDWKDLDLERCITTVIERHSFWLLQNLHMDLLMLTPPGSPFECVMTTSDSSGSSVLSLQLPSMREPLKLHVEDATGHIVLSPPTRLTRDTEARIDSDAAPDRARRLASLVCTIASDRVYQEGSLVGWKLASISMREDNRQALFGEKCRFSVFVPSKAWGNKWALAVTFTLAGEKWWVVQLKSRQDENVQSPSSVMSSAQQILANELAPGISKATLMQIEKSAVADVAFDALSKQLKELKVPYRIEELQRQDRNGNSLGPALFPAMLIRLSPLMSRFESEAWTSWAEDTVRISHHGIVGDYEGANSLGSRVRHDLRLALRPGELKNLRKNLTRGNESDTVVNPLGALAFKLLIPFGEPFARQIQERLHSVQRLDQYVAVLRQQKFECTEVSPRRLVFLYCKSPRLSVQLDFTPDGSLPVRLKLEPCEDNPHQRIKVLLERGFNATGESGFTPFTHILAATLPLLQAFERLEAQARSRHSLTVHPRSSTWFTLKFNSTHPELTFQLRFRTVKEAGRVRALWQIQRTQIAPSEEPQAAEMSKALTELWQSDRNKWLDLKTGAATPAINVGELLDKLCEVVAPFEKSAGEDSATATTIAKKEVTVVKIED